jgi:hypothetical protein
MSHLSNGAVPSLNKSELDGYQRIHEHFNILPFDRTESYEESINRFFANNQAFEDAANLPSKLHNNIFIMAHANM